MAGVSKDMAVETGGPPAQSSGADSGPVKFFNDRSFQVRVEWIGISGANREEERLLGEKRGDLEVSAQSQTDDDGWAGVGSCFGHPINHERRYLLRAGRRGHHPDRGHILAPRPFGSDGDLHPVTGDDLGMDQGRGVVPRILPPQRIGHDGSAEKAFPVPLTHPLVDGRAETAPRDVTVLSDLEKDDGAAGILADGRGRLSGDTRVGDQLIEDGPAVLRFFRVAGGAERLHQAVGRVIISLPAETGDGVGNRSSCYGTHNN